MTDKVSEIMALVDDYMCAPLKTRRAAIESRLREVVAPPVPEPTQRLQGEIDAITELNHAQWLALENVRTLAARNRKEDWAQHLLRWCAEAGNAARILRAPTEATHTQPASEPVAWFDPTEVHPFSNPLVWNIREMERQGKELPDNRRTFYTGHYPVPDCWFPFYATPQPEPTPEPTESLESLRKVLKDLTRRNMLLERAIDTRESVGLPAAIPGDLVTLLHSMGVTVWADNYGYHASQTFPQQFVEPPERPEAGQEIRQNLQAFVDQVTYRPPEPTPEPGERERFEAWAHSQGLDTLRDLPGHGDERESYRRSGTEYAWFGWQACASLPPAPTKGTTRPAQQPDTDGTAPPPPRV